jgi:hypothetical protein
MKKLNYSISIFASVIIAALILAPANSQAQNDQWSVSASNWMQYWYHGPETPDSLNTNTLSRQDSLDNRFSVDFNLGDFYAGLWLRTYQPEFNNNANEKITQRYLGWRQDGLTLHVGNFYQTFDRGMTLNAFLDDAVYRDNNLDGIKISGMYDKFDFDALSARAYGFQPGLNEFNMTRDYTFRAVRAALKPFSGFKYGVSYIHFKQTSLLSFGRSEDLNILSFNNEINKGPFNIYAEYAHKDGLTQVEEATDGDGTYLSASYSHQYFSVYGEYKNLFRLLYPDPGYSTITFNTPPPVTHNGRSLSTMVAGIPGERAYQVGTMISPSFNLNFDIAYAEAFSRGSVGERGRYYLSDGYAGVRWNPSEKIVLNSHWDGMNFNGPEGDEVETYLDGYYYFNPIYTISLSTYSRLFRPQGTKNYHEDYLTIGLSRGSFIELSIGGSASNKTYQPAEKKDPKRMAFAEVTVHFKMNDLSVFYGGERGGVVCSSGICSNRPTFKGLRVMLMSRF